MRCVNARDLAFPFVHKMLNIENRRHRPGGEGLGLDLGAMVSAARPGKAPGRPKQVLVPVPAAMTFWQSASRVSIFCSTATWRLALRRLAKIVERSEPSRYR
jgi:hypothetical protein